MDDCLKCQTSAASPAEPGASYDGLVSENSTNNRNLYPKIEFSCAIGIRARIGRTQLAAAVSTSRT